MPESPADGKYWDLRFKNLEERIKRIEESGSRIATRTADQLDKLKDDFIELKREFEEYQRDRREDDKYTHKGIHDRIDKLSQRWVQVAVSVVGSAIVMAITTLLLLGSISD